MDMREVGQITVVVITVLFGLWLFVMTVLWWLSGDLPGTLSNGPGAFAAGLAWCCLAVVLWFLMVSIAVVLVS